MVKHFFSRPKKALRLNHGIQHQGLKVYKVCSNGDMRMTFDLLRYGQICVLVAVTILEEVAWHMQICNSCVSGERIVTHGPLV